MLQYKTTYMSVMKGRCDPYTSFMNCFTVELMNPNMIRMLILSTPCELYDIKTTSCTETKKSRFITVIMLLFHTLHGKNGN
jgi:hypothetical protein